MGIRPVIDGRMKGVRESLEDQTMAMATHVVCVQNGDWLDTWDSGDEVPLYYWQKG